MAYIDYFPKPFLDELLKSNCVPFIGSGMSNNAELPEGKKMPLWSALGKSFAQVLGSDYDNSSPIESFSAYEAKYRRPALIAKLKEELFIDEAKPGKAHYAFCQLPFSKVCTTNFDYLLEDTYKVLHKKPYVKVREEQLPDLVSHDKVEILKFHGDLSNPRELVSTEEDYDNFVIGHPLLTTYLCNILLTSTPLFIGYSLDDADFRQIFQLIKSRLHHLSKCAYAIQFNCTKATRDRFERRGVQVIDLPKKDDQSYDEVLEAALLELNQYWQSNTKIVANNLIVQQALLLNKVNPDLPTGTNLCLLQVPLDELPFYYQMIVGDLTSNNIMPVSLIDVSVDFNSDWQSINSLYGASKYVIWDMDNCYLPSFDLKDKVVIAISKNDAGENNELIFVQKPSSFNVISEDLSEKVDLFWTKVRQEIKEKFKGTDVISIDTLVEKGEYQLAVIKATMKLEASVRARYKSPKDRSNYSFYELFQKALGKNFVDFRRRILMITYIRNNAVHQDYHPNRGETMEVLDAIKSIEDFMQEKKSGEG